MYYDQKQPPIFEDKFHFYFSYLDDSNNLAKGIGKFGRACSCYSAAAALQQDYNRSATPQGYFGLFSFLPQAITCSLSVYVRTVFVWQLVCYATEIAIRQTVIQSVLHNSRTYYRGHAQKGKR